VKCSTVPAGAAAGACALVLGVQETPSQRRDRHDGASGAGSRHNRGETGTSWWLLWAIGHELGWGLQKTHFRTGGYIRFDRKHGEWAGTVTNERVRPRRWKN